MHPVQSASIRRSLLLCFPAKICNQSAPITGTNEELTHHDQARRTTSFVMVAAGEVCEAYLSCGTDYIYLENRKAESLTPCSGCLLPHRCVLRPIHSSVAKCKRRNSVILSQGSSLLLQLQWYVATFCLFQLTYLITPGTMQRIRARRGSREKYGDALRFRRWHINAL